MRPCVKDNPTGPNCTTFEECECTWDGTRWVSDPDACGAGELIAVLKRAYDAMTGGGSDLEEWEDTLAAMEAIIEKAEGK